MIPIVLITLCVITFLGSGISSLIKYGYTSVFGGSSKFDNYELFALSLGTFETESQAIELASTASVQGAGSYVYAHDNVFDVIGCIYSSEDEALAVLKNMQSYSCKVIKLNYPKLSYEYKDLDKSQIVSIVDSVEYLKTLYKNMYDNIIQLDKKDISNIACSNSFNYYKSTAKTHVSNIMKLKNESSDNRLKEIVNAYIKIVDSLDNCITQLLQSNNYGYITKHTMCEICFYTLEMYTSIK
ncbi:MAG: hypothetical protein IK070_00730 [Clostridia bacterium]|nr:hypothetical protein [Clostridia bacterium]